MTGAQAGASGRVTRALLATLLAASFALRVWAGSAVLDNSYHFDERFSFRNVSALLVEGTSRPANAFYPGLSYLPQTALLAASQGLHRLTGAERLSIFDPRSADGYSPTAYLLVRLLAALYGTLSLWLTFAVGRRLFDARVGLLAAALLSAVPAHVSHSALFKPDILVVLLMLAAFSWSLDAVLAPRWRSDLLAGCGIGLAVAAKYTGVGAALPLVAGALAAGPASRRRWLGLAAAGAASVAVFVVLNPHLGVILDYLPRLWSIYESKGEAAGGSRLAVLVAEVSFLVRHHRLPVVVFVAAGLAGAGWRALSGRVERQRRLEAAMLLAAVLGYSLLYAASSKLFKGQNYLPVTPFTSLLAAWPMVAAWDRVVGWVPALRRRWAAAAVVTGVAAVLFALPAAEVYAGAVPSSFEVAALRLGALGDPRLRQLYYERREDPLRPAAAGHRMLTLPVGSLSGVDPGELDRSDAEVFYAERLDGPEGAFYWQRLARPAAQAARIERRLLAVRGPELVVITHPWALAGEPAALALTPARGRNRFRAVLPAAAPGELVSLSLWLPIERGVPRPAWVALGGRRRPIYETGLIAGRAHFLSPREAPLPAGPVAVAFEERLALRWTPRLALVRWRPPGVTPAPAHPVTARSPGP